MPIVVIPTSISEPSHEASDEPCAVFDVCSTVPRSQCALPPLTTPPSWSGPRLKAQSAVPPHAVERQQRSSTNVFVDAVATAFFDHYPLAMSPDGVWLVVMQGLATHVKCNAEELRACFVTHSGKAAIEVVDMDLTWNSPPAKWATQVPKYEVEILRRISPERATTLTPRFSTSTPNSSVAAVVCLMDMMQHYFAYGLRGGCGIPSVQLLGTPADWRELRRCAAAALDGLRCDWWRDELLPVLDQFVAAAEGRVDTAFWASTVTYIEGSGDEVPFSGWINALFPYVRGTGPPPIQPLPERDSTLPRFSVIVSSLSGQRRTVEGVTGAHSFLDVLSACAMCGIPVVNGRRVDLSDTLQTYNVRDGTTIHTMSGSVERDIRNPALAAWRTRDVAGINPSKYTSGISKAPVTYSEEIDGKDKQWSLSFEAGFTCVTQDPRTLAVRAAVGWAIVDVTE